MKFSALFLWCRQSTGACCFLFFLIFLFFFFFLTIFLIHFWPVDPDQLTSVALSFIVKYLFRALTPAFFFAFRLDDVAGCYHFLIRNERRCWHTYTINASVVRASLLVVCIVSIFVILRSSTLSFSCLSACFFNSFVWRSSSSRSLWSWSSFLLLSFFHLKHRSNYVNSCSPLFSFTVGRSIVA